jgi:uncharacterized damage-inducible protein DinB
MVVAMFKRIEDFVAKWQAETALTLRTLEALTDESLGQRITPEHRTIGRLGWHIVLTLQEMPLRAGLVLEEADEHVPVPAKAKAIAEAYRCASHALLKVVQSSWTDEHLLVRSDMYGEQWPNGLMLDILIRHEIHHRGQLTVLMRQAGLIVPSLYGPTIEQWAETGEPAPVI